MNYCSKITVLYTVGVLANVFCFQVEGSRGYSYADCTYLKENQNSTHFGTRCFCYSSGTVIKWKDIWSTFQVYVKGDEGVYVMYPMEGTRNCYEPDHFLMQFRCLLDHYWPPSPSVSTTSLDIPLEQEDTCFMVMTPRAKSEHTLRIRGKRLNKIRFGLFAFGLALFYFAGAISRSSLFFYMSGISVGVFSIVVFLLLALKRFIPSGIFIALFAAGSYLTYLGYQRLLSHWDDVMTLYWRHALGYLLLTSLVSWLVCYKNGPITSDFSLSLITWGLQSVAVSLMYYGVTYPMAFYTLLGILMLWKALPCAYRLLLGTCRLTRRLLVSFLRVFWRNRKPQRRLLTEEEYREQGKVHTRTALEELRELCNTAGFPAWDTVLRLNYPQRFASFLRDGVHVTSEEQQSHECQYSPGRADLGELLFTSSSHRALGLATGDDHSDDDDGIDYSPRTPPTPNSPPLRTATTPMPRPDMSAPSLPLFIPSPPMSAPSPPMSTPSPPMSAPSLPMSAHSPPMSAPSSPLSYSTTPYPPYRPSYPPAPPAVFAPPPQPYVILDDEDEDMDLF